MFIDMCEGEVEHSVEHPNIQPNQKGGTAVFTVWFYT